MVEATPLSVHRCRFVDFVPSVITAIAFPPLPLPRLNGGNVAGSSRTKKFGSLVVGRANGNIELCEWSGAEHENQAPQGWIVRKILLGPTPSKVDSLALTLRDPELLPRDTVPSLSDVRLFSAGGGSELVEWDLERGCILRTINSQGGTIWSISANPSSSLLALGCEDGCVRLLSLENGTLMHHRRFDRIKSRLLSMAWGPPVPRRTSNVKATESQSDSDDDEDDWSDSWLVTGGSDSSVIKWDVKTGRAVERMTTDRMRGEQTLVWAVAVLGDGTIISGDSLGMVTFWDPRTCTQLQSFSAHGADVLCIAIGPEGDSVFTSGVDQKICLFSHVKIPSSEQDRSSSLLRPTSRWVPSTSKRMHSHDVRALAVWPPYVPVPPQYQRPFSPGVAPILASGGFDMSVVVTPCASASTSKIINPLGTSPMSTFEDAYYRRLPYMTGLAPALQLAQKAHLLLCRRENTVSLWRILMKSPTPEPMYGLPNQGGYEKVLDMELNTSTNLQASAISHDGQWLAVSDLYETKLFKLVNTEGTIKPVRVKSFGDVLLPHLPTSTSTGASAIGFSPDSAKLILGLSLSSYVLVIDLGGEGQRPHLLRRFDQHRSPHAIVGDRAVKPMPSSAETGQEGEYASDEGTDHRGADDDASQSAESDDEAEDEQPLNVSITRMAFSVDGQWLATTDDRCRTHVYNMDAVQHHCVVPSMPQPVYALSFDPASPATLFLGLGNNKIEVFDVEVRRFPEWSRELFSSLHSRFARLHDPVLGIMFDPAVTSTDDPAVPQHQRSVMFWGSTWICKVRLDAPVGGGLSKKRRRQSVGKATPQAPHAADIHYMEDVNFKLVTRYRPLLFADFLVSGELVVIERPLLDVLATLPPAFFKPKYGS